MYNTKTRQNVNVKLLVDTPGLQDILSSGRKVAVDIGIAAGAQVKINRFVYWNVQKVQVYLDSISE